MKLTITRKIDVQVDELFKFARLHTGQQSDASQKWWDALRDDDKQRIETAIEWSHRSDCEVSDEQNHPVKLDTKLESNLGKKPTKRFVIAKKKKQTKPTAVVGHVQCLQCKEYKPGRWIKSGGVCHLCTAANKPRKNFDAVKMVAFALNGHTPDETCLKFGIGRTKYYHHMSEHSKAQKKTLKPKAQEVRPESKPVIVENYDFNTPNHPVQEVVTREEAKEQMDGLVKVLIDQGAIQSIKPEIVTMQFEKPVQVAPIQPASPPPATPKITADFMADMFVIMRMNYPTRLFKIQDMMKTTTHSRQFCMDVARKMRDAGYLTRVGTSSHELEMWELKTIG